MTAPSARPSAGPSPSSVPLLDLPAGAPADGVRPGPDQPRRAWVEQIMGMPISVHVRGPLAREEAGVAEDAVGRAMAGLRRVDAVFSTYRADSEISRIRAGTLAVAAADPWVQEVVALCDQARDRTGGWFDAHLPGPDGVRRFDPTGLVKGWAIERAARALAADLPGHDVLVNAGGDVALRCDRTDTPDWRLGIEDPADRTRLLATVPLRTGGMATSGTAARGAHIVVPRTGERVDRAGSVTVVGPDLTWADVHATAAFAQGDGAERYLATLAGHLSFVVRPDGTTATIEGR